MGGGDAPLPVCDRCRHFVVREPGLSTCGPCRKGYQLLVSLRSVVSPENDEAAVVYLEGCFGLLEDWIGEVKNLEKKEDKKPRGRSKEKKRRRSEDKPLKRQPTDSPKKRKDSDHQASPASASKTAQSAPDPAPEPARSSASRPSVSSRVLPPPRAPPVPVPGPTHGSVALVENSQTRAPRPSKREQEEAVHSDPQAVNLAPKVKPAPSSKQPAERTGEASAADPENKEAAKKAKRRESGSRTPSRSGRKRSRRRRRSREGEKERRRRRKGLRAALHQCPVQE